MSKGFHKILQHFCASIVFYAYSFDSLFDSFLQFNCFAPNSFAWWFGMAVLVHESASCGLVLTDGIDRRPDTWMCMSHQSAISIVPRLTNIVGSRSVIKSGLMDVPEIRWGYWTFTCAPYTLGIALKVLVQSLS